MNPGFPLLFRVSSRGLHTMYYFPFTVTGWLMFEDIRDNGWPFRSHEVTESSLEKHVYRCEFKEVVGVRV